jgi:hypothetical protein
MTCFLGESILSQNKQVCEKSMAYCVMEKIKQEAGPPRKGGLGRPSRTKDAKRMII